MKKGTTAQQLRKMMEDFRDAMKAVEEDDALWPVSDAEDEKSEDSPISLYVEGVEYKLVMSEDGRITFEPLNSDRESYGSRVSWILKFEPYPSGIICPTCHGTGKVKIN